LAHRRIEGFETQVAGREIKFFVVQGVVGNVHLAIDPAQRAVTLQHCHRVVVEPGCAALEEGSDHHYLFLSRDSGKALRGRARNGLRQIEELGIFALTKILSAEELREADDVCSAAGGFAHPVSGFVEIRVGVGRAGHLHRAYAVFCFAGHIHFPGDYSKIRIAAAMTVVQRPRLSPTAD
jgi:hypothetical protein